MVFLLELLSGIHTTLYSQVFYEVSSRDTLLGWVKPGEFEMFCVFIALCDKSHAITAANRLLRYVARESPNLFIMNAPTW